MGYGRVGYSARTLVDIEVEFDAAEARRTAHFGQSLYIAGAQLSNYAGGSPVAFGEVSPLPEVGFHIAPWSADIDANSGTGDVEPGTYAMKKTLQWDNAAGERDRSTSAAVGQEVMAATGFFEFELIPSPQATNKVDIAVRSWRTVKNPPVGAPMYAASSLDPADTAGANAYVVADVTAQHSPGAGWDDYLADEDLVKNQSDPENYGVLEHISPPSCSIVVSHYDRLLVAGIPGLPNVVAYSKFRTDGSMAGFNSTLACAVPEDTGPITAVAFLNETMVVFCTTGVYVLPGQGLNDLGQGTNYGPAQLIAADVGAEKQELVATSSDGIIFKSSKGWYLLTRGWEVQYIGKAVEEYDDDTWLSAHILEDRRELRLLSTSRCMVYHYEEKQWSEWTITDAIAPAVIWNGDWVYLASDGLVYTEDADYTNCDYSLDVELPWMTFAELLNRQKVGWFELLAEYRSACRIRVRAAYNRNPAWVDDKYWTPTGLSAGAAIMFRHGLRYPNSESVKIRLTDAQVGSADPPAGESYQLAGLAFGVGFFRKKRLWHGLAAANKQ